MCKIIPTAPAEYECLTHHKEFRSARAVPTACPIARKFAKAGTPVLPAKYSTLAPVLHSCPAGVTVEITAGSPVRVSGGRGAIVTGKLVGSFVRGTGAFAGEMAIVLRDDTNEYDEFWTGPSMGRSYVVMPC